MTTDTEAREVMERLRGVGTLARKVCDGVPNYDGSIERTADEAADLIARLLSENAALRERVEAAEARPISEYHEDMGPVVWWVFPVCEAPWIGAPSWDNWPEDYYTHFTPLPPIPAARDSQGGQT